MSVEQLNCDVYVKAKDDEIARKRRADELEEDARLGAALARAQKAEAERDTLRAELAAANSKIEELKKARIVWSPNPEEWAASVDAADKELRELRADLAAEQKRVGQYMTSAAGAEAELLKIRAELAKRDELLRYVRKWKVSGDAELAARIDAALAKEGE